MKKATLRLTSDRLSNSLMFFSVVAILSAMWSSAIHYSKPTFEIQEVVDVEYETKEVHYLTDDELSLLYSCKDEPICDTCLLISQEDAVRLMQIAVLEDHTDAKSQALIMSVILNRVESENFPNTIQEVIEQEGQFSTRKRYKKAEPDVNSHLALAMIESGEVKTDYLYFEADYAKDSWQSKHRNMAEVYGGTRFYR